MKIKKLTAAALAILAMGAPSINQAKADMPKQINTQQSNAEMKQEKQTVSKRQNAMPDMIGGVEMIHTSVGIPPKIYGQHYVRRGSHKKTNV